MARNKITSDKEIIKYIDSFIIEYPNKKLTSKNICEYMNKDGIPIQTYLLRRYKEAYKYLTSKTEERNEFHETNVVVYKELDVDDFLQRNKNNLKEALIIRDNYYKQISISASKAFSESKNVKETNRQLRCKVKKMEEQIKKLEELKGAEKTVKELKSIIYDIVYPEVANTILENRGLIEKETNAIQNTHEIKAEDFDAETLEILNQLGGE